MIVYLLASLFLHSTCTNPHHIHDAGSHTALFVLLAPIPVQLLTLASTSFLRVTLRFYWMFSAQTPASSSRALAGTHSPWYLQLEAIINCFL
jgi:hypothetical protein